MTDNKAAASNATYNIGNREIKFRAWFPNAKTNEKYEEWLRKSQRVISTVTDYEKESGGKFEDDLHQTPFMTKNVDLLKYDFSSTEMTEESKDFSDGIYMQYTGLKDKNGNEIYEGDIIGFTATREGGFHVKEPTAAVRGPVEYGSFNSDNDTYTEYIGFHINGGSIDYLLGHKDAKIIGNIFENPELLKT